VTLPAPVTAPVTPPSRHLDAWRERLTSVPPVPLKATPLADASYVLAVVAHPDDETLAMGGLLAGLARRGAEVDVLCLTSGEAAVRHLGVEVEALADRRERELRTAARRLGVRSVVTARLPDGGLADVPGTALDAVLRQLEPRPDAQVVTLWRDDPHPDHRAAARAALRAGTTLGTPVHELLLWSVHWTPPEEVRDDVTLLAHDEASLAARARALASYTSQTTPLVAGLGPVLPREVVAWPHEVLVG
jgi:LmbE family N-acetylglucosaminyl deacetylase